MWNILMVSSNQIMTTFTKMTAWLFIESDYADWLHHMDTINWVCFFKQLLLFNLKLTWLNPNFFWKQCFLKYILFHFFFLFKIFDLGERGETDLMFFKLLIFFLRLSSELCLWHRFVCKDSVGAEFALTAIFLLLKHEVYFLNGNIPFAMSCY